LRGVAAPSVYNIKGIPYVNLVCAAILAIDLVVARWGMGHTVVVALLFVQGGGSVARSLEPCAGLSIHVVA
jgi:hypothetical protein